MENEIMQMVVVAVASAPIVSGITNSIKKNTSIEGIEVILVALVVGIVLFMSVAYLRDYPLLESVLMGLLSGFASVGAFEGFKHTKEEIK